MKYINSIYELYPQPTPDFSQDYPDTKRDKGIGRITSDPASCFNSVKEFSGSNQVQTTNHKTLKFKGQLAGRVKLSVVSTSKYVMPFFPPLSSSIQE